jgi:hypothetical protein
MTHMIGKVITLNKSGSTRGGFREAVYYIAREGSVRRGNPQVPIGASEMGVMNLDASLDTSEDRANVWVAMNATALRSRRFKGNPVYHLTISWMESEHPHRDQAEQAVGHVMKALGLDECEAIWAIHRDTEHHHVHLIVNRIHPELGIVAGPPRFDYLLIDRAMREIELAQGWRHAPGPHVVRYLDGAAPEIARLSRAKRRALGLLKSRGNAMPTDLEAKVDDIPSPLISQRAARAAHNQGAPSFQEWLAGDPAQALAKAIQVPGADWSSVHRAMAGYGLNLVTKGSGMVVTTAMEGRVLAAKASQFGRWASKAALEKKLGPYQSASNLDVKVGEKGYIRFLQYCQQGRGVTTADEDEQRKTRRQARAQAKRELHERFRQEQQALTTRRKEERQALQKQHQRERDVLRLTARLRRAEYLASQKADGMHSKIATALWSFMSAQEKEAMQKRQVSERRELSKRIRGTQVWREWLEQQAEKGDEAAKAALRGLRYREQRKNQEKNGIEGEELDPLRPVLVGLKFEVDEKQMRILYRSGDGRMLFTDSGHRIDVHDKVDESLEAALRVAAQKFGGAISITGSSAFREQAARMAARLGIGVRDKGLKRIYEIERTREHVPGR